MVSRKVFVWTVGTLFAAGLLAGFIAMIVKLVPHHHPRPPPPDNYTQALNKALMFFNLQLSGKLPNHNNVSWRGNSCLNDGETSSTLFKDLSGGYYDAGDAIKFNFPQSFAMTMLSWSVIEYSAKFEAAGELTHIKDTIKWGTDYFLKTFNNTADTIDRMVSQVGSGDTTGGSTTPNDHYCWMRPEDIGYARPVTQCHSCSDLAAEMAAALASAYIVFKDNKAYSQKLAHGAATLFKFSRAQRGRYSVGNEAKDFYNSTGYYDDYIWGATCLYYATGNSSYLQLATTPGIAKHAGAFSGGPYYGVLNWDNKLPGAQVLLSRLRLFLSPGYPYEEMLSTFHNQTSIFMCSFLLYFTSFNRTRGGMIELNHGSPQPPQYVVNAAFLATVFSDYMKAADTPGWYYGPHFYSADILRKFAETQVAEWNTMQPQSLKITLKLKPEKSDENPLTTVDSPSNNVEGVDQVDSISTPQAFKNDHITEDDQNENSNYQMVLYVPKNANHSIEAEPIPVGPTSLRPNRNPCSNQASRYLPSSDVGAFTVQCDNCFKWRIIPTKEKYEQIREHITEKPFVCETGREWRPEISCDDPPDMTQDGSRLWAIDKPNIAQAPPGWERIMRIRAEGGSKFADVYYVAPSGKRLRSMVEIQRYLTEHPDHLEDSVNLSRFSFQTPTPLRENYVRKRPAHAAPSNEAGDYGMPQSLLPTEVQPISWMCPNVDTSLQLSATMVPTDSTPKVKSAKKKRGLNERSCDGELVYKQKNVGVSEPRQL